MDIITHELDNYIETYEFEEKMTDVACYNKIKMDYFLMLTIAVAWDLKYPNMNKENRIDVMKCLQRPETGKLIRLIESVFNIDQSIVKIFDLYKQGRNSRFGHTTFDKFQANRLNEKCRGCWDALMNLEKISDSDSDLIRGVYQKNNDIYYVRDIKENGEMLTKKFGEKKTMHKFQKQDLLANMKNKENDLKKGDVFIYVGGFFIKISPFIQIDENEEFFMMLMDIETSPLAFKMAYVYRTAFASESEKYLDEFPKELREFFPKEKEKKGKNGIVLNDFSQYKLFEQEYYQDIHKDVQKKLDNFVRGNMAYGAVRGVGGVGKTSVVFMWMNRIWNNEEGILEQIRSDFNLRRIIFLSAKKKIYSREINERNSNFYDVESDVSSYSDVIESIYSEFHSTKKEGITFEEKEDYLKKARGLGGVLIIIDDYESLPADSREKIQNLKDFLKPNVVKMLITTRFASKESKDIIVESLNEEECAKMTDRIFATEKWREDITTREIHQLTGGLPLLIWYAKARFSIGQLSSKNLKEDFVGPVEGLEGYLYDNFVECFENQFTKDFLMIVTRYYKLHQILQISKKTAIFLCLENPKDYKEEEEEFYFQELTDLKLISINQTTQSIDYSPLMLYMDKTSKKQKADKTYQKDNLKVLERLDEEHYKDLCAVVKSTEYLEEEIKRRILYKILDFSQSDNNVRALALKEIFALSQPKDKIMLYRAYIQTFQDNPVLLKDMLEYILEDKEVLSKEYDLVKNFIYSISVFFEKQDLGEEIAIKAVKLSLEIMDLLLEDRDDEEITNEKLGKEAEWLRGIILIFIGKIRNKGKKRQSCKGVNLKLEDVSTYCKISKIE